MNNSIVSGTDGNGGSQADGDRQALVGSDAVRMARSHLNGIIAEVEEVRTMKIREGHSRREKISRKIDSSVTLLRGLYAHMTTACRNVEELKSSPNFKTNLSQMKMEIDLLWNLRSSYADCEFAVANKKKKYAVKLLNTTIQCIKKIFDEVLMAMEGGDDDSDDGGNNGDSLSPPHPPQGKPPGFGDNEKKQKHPKRNTEGDINSPAVPKKKNKRDDEKDGVGSEVVIREQEPEDIPRMNIEDELFDQNPTPQRTQQDREEGHILDAPAHESNEKNSGSSQVPSPESEGLANETDNGGIAPMEEDNPIVEEFQGSTTSSEPQSRPTSPRSSDSEKECDTDEDSKRPRQVSDVVHLNRASSPQDIASGFVATPAVPKKKNKRDDEKDGDDSEVVIREQQPKDIPRGIIEEELFDQNPTPLITQQDHEERQILDSPAHESNKKEGGSSHVPFPELEVMVDETDNGGIIPMEENPNPIVEEFQGSTTSSQPQCQHTSPPASDSEKECDTDKEVEPVKRKKLGRPKSQHKSESKKADNPENIVKKVDTGKRAYRPNTDRNIDGTGPSSSNLAPRVGCNTHNAKKHPSTRLSKAKREKVDDKEAQFEEEQLGYYALQLALSVAEKKKINVAKEQQQKLHSFAKVEMIDYQNEEVNCEVADGEPRGEENYMGLNPYFDGMINGLAPDETGTRGENAFVLELTAKSVLNPLAVTGNEVAEKVGEGFKKQGSKSNRNFVHCKRHDFALPAMPLPSDLAVPTRIFDAVDYKKDNFLPELLSQPFSCIRNMEKATGFRRSKFSREALLKENSEASMDVLSMLPQPPEMNRNSEIDEPRLSWKTPELKKYTMKLTEYIKQEQKIVEIVEHHLDRLLSKDVKLYEFEALKNEIREKTGRRLLFGTNFEFQPNNQLEYYSTDDFSEDEEGVEGTEVSGAFEDGDRVQDQTGEESDVELGEEYEDEDDLELNAVAHKQVDAPEKHGQQSDEEELTLRAIPKPRPAPGSEEFAPQYAEIGKLPTWMQPKGMGNMLRLIKRNIEGINTPNVYLKFPSSRTQAHAENSALGSVNWNFGPGNCVWFVVSLEFGDQMYKLIQAKSKGTLDNTYWPLVEEIRREGIPVQVFLQKPGDLVYVSYGSIHWVQSLGFADNLSWNVGVETKTQLDVMALFFDRVNRAKGKPLFPVEELFWEIAIHKRFTDNYGMFKTIKHVLSKLLVHIEIEWKSIKLTKQDKPEKQHVNLEKWNRDLRCDNPDCGVVLYNVYCRRKLNYTTKTMKKLCVNHYQVRAKNQWFYREEPAFYRRVFTEYQYTGPVPAQQLPQ